MDCTKLYTFYTVLYDLDLWPPYLRKTFILSIKAITRKTDILYVTLGKTFRKGGGQMSIKKEKLKELKAEADNAFKAKQEAYQNRKVKFDELLSLVNQHNAKLWDDYKIKCKDNGKPITKYKEKADILHEEMVSLFESSQEAYYNYEGALAKELSIEGHKKQEALKYYNKKVQEASRLNEKAKEYAQKNQLPKSVNKLLKMELSTLQEKFVRNEEWTLFKKILNDAKFYDAEFHRLSSEYDKKQEVYKNEEAGGWEPYQHILTNKAFTPINRGKRLISFVSNVTCKCGSLIET